MFSNAQKFEAGITVSLPPPVQLKSCKSETQLPAGATGTDCYAPSPWRSTQIQQGSGFLQELKAAIQLDKLESRAGTVTWRHHKIIKPA